MRKPHLIWDDGELERIERRSQIRLGIVVWSLVLAIMALIWFTFEPARPLTIQEKVNHSRNAGLDSCEARFNRLTCEGLQ